MKVSVKVLRESSMLANFHETVHRIGASRFIGVTYLIKGGIREVLEGLRWPLETFCWSYAQICDFWHKTNILLLNLHHKCTVTLTKNLFFFFLGGKWGQTSDCGAVPPWLSLEPPLHLISHHLIAANLIWSDPNGCPWSDPVCRGFDFCDQSAQVLDQTPSVRFAVGSFAATSCTISCRPTPKPRQSKPLSIHCITDDKSWHLIVTP